MTWLEFIDNLELIDNGLAHIEFELSRPLPSKFRVARESHLLLYRCMIQALRGTANLIVTLKPAKHPMHKYHKSDLVWKEIHKEAVPHCHRAWRFSSPVECAAPGDATPIAAETAEDTPRLIPFYYALAMIQAECFMTQYVMSKPVPVGDLEMRTLEWLHEDIRNEYEHFVPTALGAPEASLSSATSLCLRLSGEVLFQSKNAFIPPEYRSLESRMTSMIEKIYS
jgi:hypothetical protein